MTLLFFTDESTDRRVQLHLGLLASGEQVTAATEQLDRLTEPYCSWCVCGRDAELHGIDLFHGTGDWRQVPVAERIELYSAALGVLAITGIKVICRGVDLPSFRRRYPKREPDDWVFRNLLERLNERVGARGEFALVIADEIHDKEWLRSELRDGQRYGTPGYRGQRLVRIIDTAHFVDSRRSRLIQLADLAAFIHRRHLNGPEHDAQAEAGVAERAALVQAAAPNPQGQYNNIWHPH